MPLVEVRVPKVAMSVDAVDVVSWHVQVGDRIQKGSPLVDLETEKATFTVASEVEGEVVEILAQPGETLPMGASLCRIRVGE
ncbi:MAG: lipoyl domain-containing protein [Armatimonadota bacterium]|nr:lipoyl domain-containing protein [Armatimonadota bacterium]MDR7438975.1 lipoyl domain-containing protein [Armatimonadota bacterium]MDR7562873.1 lipoyl domain-containing protein [Armatimonadota bacterium]MDR7567876.1 lipoyl domain-containing protein [Armatimonadota bacterium]MDR7602322.1 lipoyl domain-containing protein [Armatimonadota bacterium]